MQFLPASTVVLLSASCLVAAATVCYNKYNNALLDLCAVGEMIACSGDSAFISYFQVCKECKAAWGANVYLD